jgi:hypothetical protein
MTAEPSTGPTKNDWPKVTICCVLLALAAANQFGGDWHSSLAWPWNGLSRIGGVIVEAISPLVAYLPLNPAEKMG